MNLLITTPMAPQDLKTLQTKFTVTYRPWTDNKAGFSQQETLQMLQETKADAFISELDDVCAGVLDAYHDLLFIGDCRAVPANIDVDAATRYNIPILNTPARNAQAVAELLVGLLVNFMRHVQPSIRWMGEGGWTTDAVPYFRFMGNEICGKTVGFVGFGAVAKITARILAAFGASIRYYDPYVDMGGAYQKQGLEDLFQTSDIVSIHLPVLDSTRGLVSAALLASMKEDAVFVNTARSAVVDTDALYGLLKSGAIRGAVLDVYDSEPPREAELQMLALPNVLGTPHICGATYEVTDHQSHIITRSVLKWLNKEDLEQIVYNKSVLQKI